MTKAEIVQALYTKVGGFSKKESADIVDLVFEMMKETLGRGEKIKISGFGNFVLRDKRQRPGRNPQTGDPIKISERRVLTFKASQILKQALNPKSGNGHVGATPPPTSGSVLSADADGGARSGVVGTPLGVASSAMSASAIASGASGDSAKE
jgi:integration host factor subunit alpha